MFVGVFTASRFVAIFTAGIFSPASVLFASLFLVLTGSLLLVFMQQIATGAVWAGVVLQAVMIIFNQHQDDAQSNPGLPWPALLKKTLRIDFNNIFVRVVSAQKIR
jgi:hypothetical protein